MYVILNGLGLGFCATTAVRYLLVVSCLHPVSAEHESSLLSIALCSLKGVTGGGGLKKGHLL